MTRNLAILCASLCAEGYRICLDLFPHKDIACEEVLARPGTRFAPIVSSILAHSVFH
jgi:hypothetical protein